MVDRTLLSSLVAASNMSMRDISRKLGWPQSNMSAAFHGARPLPQKWLFPLLDILGLTEQALPHGHKPWLASGDEIANRDELLTVLEHFFPDGGIARQIWPDVGLRALRIASRGRLYGLRDPRGIARVRLLIKRVPEELDDPEGPAPVRLSEADLTRLGLECLPMIRVPLERYKRWGAGEVTNKEFDEDVLAQKVREPSWKDVVEAAKRRGIKPGDAMAALMELKQTRSS